MLLRLSLRFKNKYSFLTSKILIKKTTIQNKCLYQKKPPRKIGMASNDCLPYWKKSYFAAVEGAASVETTVEGTASVADGTTIVAGTASVAEGAAVSVVVVVSSLLLQAANAAAITNTKKSFFMLSVFEFCLNNRIRHLYPFQKKVTRC